eukprot:1052591-Lingulodinium_polyedra.AAC.1
MSGSLFIRSEQVEVAHSACAQTIWSVDHYFAQSPKPAGGPQGVVYRAEDLQRPVFVARRDYVW